MIHALRNWAGQYCIIYTAHEKRQELIGPLHLLFNVFNVCQIGISFSTYFLSWGELWKGVIAVVLWTMPKMRKEIWTYCSDSMLEDRMELVRPLRLPVLATCSSDRPRRPLTIAMAPVLAADIFPCAPPGSARPHWNASCVRINRSSSAFCRRMSHKTNNDANSNSSLYWLRSGIER